MKKWSLKTYKERMLKGQAELYEIETQSGPRGALNEALKQLNSLWELRSSQDSLDSLIYSLLILKIQVNHSYLPKSQITTIFNHCEKILRLNRINPTNSRLALIYSDLWLLKSQILESDGEHWSAIWKHYIAKHLSSQKKSEHPSHFFANLGHKTLRLGRTSMAITLFDKALTLPAKPKDVIYIRKGQLTAMRYLNEDDPTYNKLLASCQKNREDSLFETDLTWEKALRNIARSHDPSPLFTLIKKNSSHYKATYLVDAYMFSRATKTQKFTKMIPKVRTLLRYKNLNMTSLGPYFKAAQYYEEIQDPDRPFYKKMERAEEIFAKSKTMATCDQVLLTLLALTRWLQRVNQLQLACLVFNEYCDLSLKISNHKRKDSLGVAYDLLEKYHPA